MTKSDILESEKISITVFIEDLKESICYDKLSFTRDYTYKWLDVLNLTSNDIDNLLNELGLKYEYDLLQDKIRYTITL